MKKFILMSVGFETPTPEVQQAWGKWFASIEDRIVDSGNVFSAAKEVTKNGVNELPRGLDAITGYTVINAENIDEAVKVAQTSPIITAMRVYEAASM